MSHAQPRQRVADEGGCRSWQRLLQRLLTRCPGAGNPDFELEHIEEAFTSEFWIVRIYKVKGRENRA